MNRLLLAVSLVLFGGAQAIAGVDSMDLGSTSVDSTGGGTVTVTGASSGDLQGFVISVSHDSAVITLDSIDILGTDTDIAGAEFVVPTTYADGGTIGVVLDFNAPYDGQVISGGSGLSLANYNYSCNNAVFYTEGEAAPAAHGRAQGPER